MGRSLDDLSYIEVETRGNAGHAEAGVTGGRQIGERILRWGFTGFHRSEAVSQPPVKPLKKLKNEEL